MSKTSWEWMCRGLQMGDNLPLEGSALSRARQMRGTSVRAAKQLRLSKRGQGSDYRCRP